MSAHQSRHRPGLALIAAGAAGYIGIAASIGLDRAATNHPELTAWVPHPFRQFVLAKAAERAIAAGQSTEALTFSQQLLRRDPLSTNAAGLVGTARLGVGDPRGAANAFRTSAKLGWRDAATQVYWFDAALRAQDYDRAGMRFSAIARQWPYAPAIDQLSARLESDPRGLSMLARQVALGPSWALAYATPRAFQPLDRLAGRATVLAAAGAMGGKLGCDAIAPMVGSLVDPRPVLAGKLWASQCTRSANPGNLADGSFEAQPLTGRVTAFDWQFPGNGAIESTVVEQGGMGRVLRLRSSGASMLPVAVQRLILPAGTYAVSWLESGDGPSRIAASLSCGLERAQADPRQGEGIKARRIASVRNDGACPAPFVQLWIRPGSDEVTIDNIAIAPT